MQYPFFLFLFFFASHIHSMISNTEEKQLSVSEIYHKGHFVKLSDGSYYKIAPDSSILVGSWLLGPNVTLTSSSDPIYNTIITNVISNTSVLAKKITKEELDEALKELTPFVEES